MWTRNSNTNGVGVSLGKREAGYSLIELMVVLGIILIMSAISLPYILNYENQYKSEVQCLKIMDLMREASQRALNQRRSVRFEVDVTLNQVHIIDEVTAGDDVLLKSVPVESTSVLKMDLPPTPLNRAALPGYADAVFAIDAIGHLKNGEMITGSRVFAIVFRSDGAVVNAANIPISRTLFIYPPTSATSDTASDARQIRGITIYGGSGAVRYWKYNGTTFFAG